MFRLAQMLFVLLVLGLSLPEAAKACTCIPPRPPAEALVNAKAVFAGSVKSMDQRGQDVIVRFEIERGFKGTSGRTITVTTYNNSAGCGYGFERGKRYMVYTSSEDLQVSLCSRTAQLSEAREDLQALDALDLLDEQDNKRRCGGPTLAVMQGMMFILVGLGFIGFREKRKAQQLR